MGDIKDSVANLTTITGTGMVMMNWNEILTFCLLVTGVVLNIQRIYHNRKKKDQE
mgnify:FL=1